MRRGEIWTLQADGYASKPRPVVIVQNDAVDRFDSVITCLLTSYDSSDITRRGCGLNRMRKTVSTRPAM
ncbi:type II toxin-antitoxin system PemK/MazF family toxin [Bifidobacterium myosotis]|uniref:type II toxin-antitoxin system PemK/MazF family toxin n=1 Tax=Bifidobacterium myosotis TaxID=1630166 RepID=UPI0022771038|nr:type II toxin-antitoxin system PemK/MazF family toxin [Bifidobacterium myosotis]